MGDDRPVSDLHLLEMDADRAGELVDNLTFQPAGTPEEESALLAALPPADRTAPMTVVTSLRLPLDLKQRIDVAAKVEGVSPSAWLRRAAESVLAGQDRTNLVNIDDVIRAVRAVPPAA